MLSRTITESRRFGFGKNAVIRETYHAKQSFDEDWIEDSATYWTDDDHPRRNGRPVTSTDEDGVTTAYDYAFGDYDPATHVFTPNASGTALRTIVTRTHHSSLITHHFPTQSLTIEDAVHGTTLYTATLLRSTGATLDWQANAHDDKNRLRATLHSDGSSTTNAYSCCRLLWKTDRNGFKTLRLAETGKDHLYYAMEEVSLADLPGYGYGHRTTMHFMDALGRETNTIVTAVGDPGSATTRALADGVSAVPANFHNLEINSKITFCYGGRRAFYMRPPVRS